VLEADLGREEGRIDVLVSNAGIRIVKPGIDLPFGDQVGGAPDVDLGYQGSPAGDKLIGMTAVRRR
jgi:NAD(P)-dependent dehydrogenase (short-subunit alcohol dehydrogenase family)